MKQGSMFGSRTGTKDPTTTQPSLFNARAVSPSDYPRTLPTRAIRRAVLHLLTRHFDISTFRKELGGEVDPRIVRDALATVVAGNPKLADVGRDAAILLGIQQPGSAPYDQIHSLGQSAFVRARHPSAALRLAVSLYGDEFREGPFLGLGSGPNARDEIFLAQTLGIEATAVDSSPVSSTFPTRGILGIAA